MLLPVSDRAVFMALMVKPISNRGLASGGGGGEGDLVLIGKWGGFLCIKEGDGLIAGALGGTGIEEYLLGTL